MDAVESPRKMPFEMRMLFFFLRLARLAECCTLCLQSLHTRVALSGDEEHVQMQIDNDE